jgi:hypothetical protein
VQSAILSKGCDEVITSADEVPVRVIWWHFLEVGSLD